MKKLSSFGLSVIIHLLILVVVVFAYTSYKHLQKAKKETKEKLLCIQTRQVVSNVPAPKKVEKKVQKQKPTTKPKKIPKKKPLHVKKKSKKQLPLKKVKQVKTVKKIEKKETQKKVLKEVQPIIPPTKPITTPSPAKTSLQEQKTTKPLNTKASHTAPMSTTVVKKEYSQEYIDKNIAKIRELIAQNIYYPRKARRRHIEGEVVLQFSITTSGTITNVKVLSSNHDVLSYAAKQVLILIEEKVPKPKEKVTLTLPIEYKLY